ncbi:hypothetical protein F4777DRAFT_553661 [Nemania sp. FL0916]|nr:hypothetical protein F4777DRAFT_553661 [Nemania sp. FL0916]
MHANLTFILGFCIIYLGLVGYTRSVCWKDPTSLFFQAERAHVPKYSTLRIQQAVEYAESIGKASRRIHPPQGHLRDSLPELCIGVPSIQRPGISYLKSTLGSLQQGLTVTEREKLYFAVFIAHTNQSEHEDFRQPWLNSMADELLSYRDLGLAREMELNQTHEIKSKYDYSIALEACVKTGAPYILMIEDDVIFLDGWFHRVTEALDLAAAKSRDRGHPNFFYLRLFYYEGLRGWNKESWPWYLNSSIRVTAITLSIILAIRRQIPRSRPYITPFIFGFIALVVMPSLILLYFAAGANCVAPQPSGVRLMAENACCGQGLVFPRSTARNELLPHFRQNRWSTTPTDSFIEEYADATGGLRWALTPVVMQHVGGESSHGVFRGQGMTPSRIWNFQFEENDATRLSLEHSLFSEE